MSLLKLYEMFRVASENLDSKLRACCFRKNLKLHGGFLLMFVALKFPPPAKVFMVMLP
jgi:hypothetical protein